MGSFLRENWPWIVTPIVLLVIALVLVVNYLGNPEDGQFIYNLF